MEKNNERKSGTQIIADTIMAMTYSDLVSLADTLVQMQKGAMDDNWKWNMDEVHGEYGLAQMLYSWAEAVDQD